MHGRRNKHRIAFIIKSLWYIPAVTITMMVDDSVYATLSVPKGSSSVVFTPENVTGIFRGWFYDPGFESEYNPLIPIDENITLYAKGVHPLIFTTDPVADGEVQAIEGQPGTVSFRATDSKDYTSALWDFGDGHTSTDLYATHYYSEPGTYTATLTVFNNHGSDATTYTIEVPSADAGGGIHWTYVVVIAMVCALGGAAVARRLL